LFYVGEPSHTVSPMPSPGKSKQWIWSLLIFLLLLLTGISFLKNSKHTPSEEKFEVPVLTAPLTEEQPLYQDEIIDPETIYPMAHVASMTELADGTLAATWYAGSGELAPDVSIFFSTKIPEALVWSQPKVIMTRFQAIQELGRYVKGLGNALLFASEDGILHLIYITVAFGKWSGSHLNLTSSYDGGYTWNKSRRLFLSPFLNLSELVKNSPVPLVSGGWAVPVYQEFLAKFPEILWLLPGKDGSLNATKSRIAGGCSFFQPSLTALSEKEGVSFCRDYRSAEKIWSTETQDAGRTWKPPQPTSLPNHDSGVASLRLASGALLLAFNDGGTARDQLRLALSKDQGHTWQRIATIAQEPNGDFCYPYFFKSHDGLIHLLYSWKRRHIHHVVFNEAWVEAQDSQMSCSHSQ
jgi:predicted neuraminidase